METWIAVAGAILLFYAGVAAHELGHALACRRANVPVDEICLLGWPLPWVSPLVLPIRAAAFPNTRWVIHPLPIGAYIQPNAERLKAATRRERIAVLAAGPIASLLYGGVLVLLASCVLAVTGGITDADDLDRDPSHGMFIVAALTAAFLLGLVYLLRWRRWFHFLLLAIGILMMPALLYLFATMIRDVVSAAKPWHEVFPGPFGLVRVFRDMVIQWSGNAASASQLASISGFIAGLFSVIIGLANMAPLCAGDGTMMVMEHMPETLARWLLRLTIAIVCSMLVFSIIGDILWIYSWFVPG